MRGNPVRLLLAVAFCYTALVLFLAPAATAGNGSDCCEASGGLGCDDSGCTQLVCGLDSFCCEVEWDSICAGEALAFCGGGVCNDGDGGACIFDSPFACVVATDEPLPVGFESRAEVPEAPADVCTDAGGVYQGDGSSCEGVPTMGSAWMVGLLAAMLLIGLIATRRLSA